MSRILIAVLAQCYRILCRSHFLVPLLIRHVQISHNAPYLPPKILHKHCFQFLLGPGADPGFFLGGGALVSCSTSRPINHIVFFFCRIPVVLENHRSSQGRVRTPCTLPLDPPLGTAVIPRRNEKQRLCKILGGK